MSVKGGMGVTPNPLEKCLKIGLKTVTLDENADFRQRYPLNLLCNPGVSFTEVDFLTLSLDQTSPYGRWPCSSGCMACIGHRVAAAARGNLSVGKRSSEENYGNLQ